MSKHSGQRSWGYMLLLTLCLALPMAACCLVSHARRSSCPPHRAPCAHLISLLALLSVPVVSDAPIRAAEGDLRPIFEPFGPVDYIELERNAVGMSVGKATVQ